MTPKEWLQRGWKINQRINRLLFQKQQAKKALLKNECTLESYDNFEKLINSHIDELFKIKIDIINALTYIHDEKLFAVLFNRYVNFYTWERIAENMNYSVVHVYRLHGQALKEFKKVMNTENI